ncbi:MAG: DUF86 domain-containing protein [Mariprofundales bacterium]|nr:DUF86 domain-containing protein [Mariprofundales bacterium]
MNKVAIIERCLRRIDEEYTGHEADLATDYTCQDAIVLNLQRACEAAIDAGMHVVRLRKLGIPQQSRDAFVMMQEASLLDANMAARMQAMVGFRNIAVHDYRKLNIDILRSILNTRLGDFRDYCHRLLQI